MSTEQTILGYSDAENVFAFSCADNEIVLANIGDYGTENASEQNVASLVAAWKPDAVFTNGDNSQADYDYDDDVEPYYGHFVNRGIFYPCPGNHDWDDGTLAAYFDYFGSIVGKQYYYQVTLGPVTLFMLDGNTTTPDGNDSDSNQAVWLAREAAACKSPWKLACIHQPPYSSSAIHGNTSDSQWDYATAGIDIVFSGHDHLYERSYTGGVYYIVNGLGGQTIYDFEATPNAESQVRYNSLHGAGKLIATPTKLVWRFYSYSGAAVDELTLEK